MLATTCPSSIRSRRLAPPIGRLSRRQNARPEKRVAGEKTAPRKIFSAAPKTRPEVAPQTLETHQENYVWVYDFASGCAVAPNTAATTNGNDTLLGKVNLFIATVGGQGLTNAVNTATPVANAALGGAAGFQNVLTLGLSSTAGFDQNAVATGQSVGRATSVAVAAVGTAGAFSLASGTPYFFSGAGASAQAAASGYIVTDTAGGMVASGAQQALNTVFGARIGGTIGYYGIWYPTSAVYATTSGLLNGVVGYTGNGTGQIWTQVEQPILQFLGTTIKGP